MPHIGPGLRTEVKKVEHDKIKAMLILNELANRVSIPAPYLENSEAKICVKDWHAVEGGYKGLWYTAIHDGTSWELIRKTDAFSITTEEQENTYVLLGPKAVKWLTESVELPAYWSGRTPPAEYYQIPDPYAPDGQMPFNLDVGALLAYSKEQQRPIRELSYEEVQPFVIYNEKNLDYLQK